MNSGTRFILLLVGGFWFPIGLVAGREMALANRLSLYSATGVISLLVGAAAFGAVWAVAALLSRYLPRRPGLILSAGVLLVPFWGVVRWINRHYLPGVTDTVTYLGNLGMLLLLIALWFLLAAISARLGPHLSAAAPWLVADRRVVKNRWFVPGLVMLAFWSAAFLVVSGEADDATLVFPPAEASDVKLMVVGIDGATWDVINPLLADGDLPHLRELMAEGHFGPLPTLKLWAASPVLWTTMATGVMPQKHGIQFFVVTIRRLPFTDQWIAVPPNTAAPMIQGLFRVLSRIGLSEHQVVPVNGTMRRAPALWEIASAAGRRSLVIGWWATWPAVPIHGVMVSDMNDLLLARLHGVAEEGDFGYLNGIPHLVHPPEVQGVVADILQRAAEVAERDWTELVPDALVMEARQSTPDSLDPSRPLSYLRYGYLSDKATLLMAKHFLQQGIDYDLTCLYFRGLDWVEHYLWDALEPEFFPADSPGVGDPRLAEVVPAYYRFLDRALGELMESVDDRTVVMVVSDHGHRKAVPPGIDGNHRGTHFLTPHPDGIILLRGPMLRENNRVMLTDADLIDLTPTALYLLGLPRSREMDGDLIRDAFDPGLIARRPPRVVGSMRSLRPAGPSPSTSPMDRQAHDRLRSLGYLH